MAASLRDGQGRGMRIILIEDDELIRETTVELLELAGHETVAAAASGQEALAAAPALAADLAIIDYSLPDMDGDEAATRLREIFPALPIVITSGRRLDHSSLSLAPPVHFLQKPYDLDTLTTLISKTT